MGRRIVVAALLIAAASSGQAPRQAVFLTDGTGIAVREYEISESRVRYFSTERGQWEEVPTEIVDVERTKAHNGRLEQEFAERKEEERLERVAERRGRTELHSVPLEDGVYYLRDGQPVAMEQAFYEVGRSAGRSALNVLAPVPVIAGKRNLWIKGLASETATSEQKPVFYLRLESFDRFGIVRVKPEAKKDRRIVQEIYNVPRTDQQAEAQEEVEIFRQQLAPLVYKIWPVEPLEAGEYAVVEFTPGESDLRVWDFSHLTAGGSGPE